MSEALTRHDFDVEVITEQKATRAGIVGAYQDLVAATTSGDAVVVYYSGHGGRSPNAMRTREPSQPAWLQYIVPTDIDDRSGGEFRGILAEELSALQRQLTDKTENVTSIFDCCHSARMFRDPSIVPKANDHLGFPWEAVAARWDAVRASGGADLGDVNPLAVQVVACGPAQSAYELAESSIGGSHGALTAALVSVLRRGDAAQLSWREVIEIVRPQILDVVPSQRPDILGPQSARLLFSLAEKDASGVLSIVESDGGVWVERAALFGVAIGDSYALVAPGGDPAHPIAEGVIDAVVRRSRPVELRTAVDIADRGRGAGLPGRGQSRAAGRLPCRLQGIRIGSLLLRHFGTHRPCGLSPRPRRVVSWPPSPWMRKASLSSTRWANHYRANPARSRRHDERAGVLAAEAGAGHSHSRTRIGSRAHRAAR